MRQTISLARKSSELPSPRRLKKSLSRRLRLFCEPLEERILLTVLGPGESWSDSYTDSNGNYHPGTVSVYNGGPGWIDAGGGGGSASISPGIAS